jgi:hypothetical protein
VLEVRDDIVEPAALIRERLTLSCQRGAFRGDLVPEGLQFLLRVGPCRPRPTHHRRAQQERGKQSQPLPRSHARPLSR